MKKCFRQGEILFIKVDLPEELNPDKIGKVLSTKVIREGEVTGHQHEIVGSAVLIERDEDTNYFRLDSGESFGLPEGTMFLTASEAIEIKHPEHKPLKLAKGNYAVRIQREYDETRNRLVSD